MLNVCVYFVNVQNKTHLRCHLCFFLNLSKVFYCLWCAFVLLWNICHFIVLYRNKFWLGLSLKVLPLRKHLSAPLVEGWVCHRYHMLHFLLLVLFSLILDVFPLNHFCQNASTFSFEFSFNQASSFKRYELDQPRHVPCWMDPSFSICSMEYPFEVYF